MVADINKININTTRNLGVKILRNSLKQNAYRAVNKIFRSETLQKKIDGLDEKKGKLLTAPFQSIIAENQTLKEEINKQKEFFGGMLVNLKKPVDVILGSDNGVSAPGNIISSLLAKKYTDFTKEDIDKVREQLGIISSLTKSTYEHIVAHLTEWGKSQTEGNAFGQPIPGSMPTNEKMNINTPSAFRYWRSRDLGTARLKIFKLSVLGTMLKFANLFNPSTTYKSKIEEMIDDFKKTSDKLLEGPYKYVLENKKLREELKTKARLFNLMVHDLKTPFNGIMGMCQLIDMDWKDKNIEEDYNTLGSCFEAIEFSAKSSLPLLDQLNSLKEATSIERMLTKLNLFDTVGSVLDIAKIPAGMKKVELKNLVPRNLVITGARGLSGRYWGISFLTLLNSLAGER